MSFTSFPYMPDNTPFNFEGIILPDVVTIGWIEYGKPYKRGTVVYDVLEKIQSMIQRDPFMVVRSMGFCELCKKGSGELVEIGYPNGMLWVPSVDHKKIYITSTHIIHDILCHGYQPPHEFLDGVLAFDLSSDWRAEKEFEKIVLKYKEQLPQQTVDMYLTMYKDELEK